MFWHAQQSCETCPSSRAGRGRPRAAVSKAFFIVTCDVDRGELRRRRPRPARRLPPCDRLHVLGLGLSMMGSFGVPRGPESLVYLWYRSGPVRRRVRPFHHVHTRCFRRLLRTTGAASATTSAASPPRPAPSSSVSSRRVGQLPLRAPVRGGAAPAGDRSRSPRSGPKPRLSKGVLRRTPLNPARSAGVNPAPLAVVAFCLSVPVSRTCLSRAAAWRFRVPDRAAPPPSAAPSRPPYRGDGPARFFSPSARSPARPASTRSRSSEGRTSTATCSDHRLRRAFLDYDGDGRLHVFLVNGTHLEGFPKGREPDQPPLTGTAVTARSRT